jgi:hypothetical protein
VATFPHMFKQFILGLAAVACFGIGSPSPAQIESRPVAKIEISSVFAVPQIYVSLRLTTAEQQVFVPYCGESENGQKVLCTLGAHLEVQSRQGWSPVKLRTNYGVLGASRPGRAGGRLIAPKSGETFSFEFSRRFFEIEPGQQLRVVVDVWPDEQSLKTDGKSSQLTSPPFNCPDTGAGK